MWGDTAWFHDDLIALVFRAGELATCLGLVAALALSNLRSRRP